MAINEVQQLRYDGKRLFCPDHLNQALEEAQTNSEKGTFSMVCTFPTLGAAGATCMNSAERPSRQDMQDQLDKLD